jgi:hypothetical protein
MATDSTRPMSRDASRILAEQFARGLETTSGLLQRLQTEVNSSAVTLEGLKKEVSAMRSDVDSLSKIIRDGNGERSLVARLMIIEKNAESFQAWIDEQKRDKDEAKKSQEEIIQVNNKGKWQLKIALISSGLAFVGTLVSAILNFLGD